MEETLLRRVARKVSRCGRATVEAPDEVYARAWARVFADRGYDAQVEEGMVDGCPAWLLIVEIGSRAVAASA